MSFQRIALMFWVTALFSLTQARAQPPTRNPKLLAGPWESVNASGIDSFLFNFETSFSGPPEHQQIARQEANIRVGYRRNGKEAWGWFATKEKATPQAYRMRDDHSFTLFDGKRLRIHFAESTDLRPFDLDVTFSPVARRWTGILVRSGRVRHVVFERPRPSAAIQNVFVGDWESEPDPDSGPPLGPGSLQIRESTDGVLSAWLDRMIGGRDERDGEPLRVVSATDSNLALETTSNGGPSFQYRGVLFEGGHLITGAWSVIGGEHLNAPDRFRRVPTNAAARRSTGNGLVAHSK